jgi:hypothetical protein
MNAANTRASGVIGLGFLQPNAAAQFNAGRGGRAYEPAYDFTQ